MASDFVSWIQMTIADEGNEAEGKMWLANTRLMGGRRTQDQWEDGGGLPEADRVQGCPALE
jgi:hypothetical protein